jgi:hypothetical protein
MSGRSVKRKAFLLAIAFVLLAALGAQAAEIGHYAPSVLNIRDYFVPHQGFYAAMYNVFYSSDTYKNGSGDAVDSITLGGGTIDVETDLNMYTLAPTLMWVSPWKVMGAHYAAYITPTFGNIGLGAALSTTTILGASEKTADFSQFGVGDLYVQPVWLGWSLKHWDFELGYGFYAPIGKYDVVTTYLPPPIDLTVKGAAPDNIGLGFWSHQFQGGVAWYPWEHRGTAVMMAVTYEFNSRERKLDITPGSHVAINWGISQILPLSENKLLLEVGVKGFSLWQVSPDYGDDAINGDVFDQVHGIGGQLGLIYIPWNLSVNASYTHEFGARDRFEGDWGVVSIGMKF